MDTQKLDDHMRASLILCTVSVLFVPQAYAGGPLAEKIRENPTCPQFNDGCSICEISQGVASCSSPAIACTETEWHCALDPSKTGQSSEGGQLTSH
ncbi:hypothetical protein [Mesorhizobium sp. M4B.F.Ca.ET.049.02.1.2]|uniref:hypothetical protein n=1 Tax=Mesorhizobium sp. M4B.F.Ca.ET.049.02.1.2 TaxID=2496752 RepID=UPI000FCB1A08|nr:hypothetical protein [Mesorhizobium sp. M4B.F.Ca.ET.049.02.1.2]